MEAIQNRMSYSELMQKFLDILATDCTVENHRIMMRIRESVVVNYLNTDDTVNDDVAKRMLHVFTSEMECLRKEKLMVGNHENK